MRALSYIGAGKIRFPPTPDIQTDRQTYRQTYIHTYTDINVYSFATKNTNLIRKPDNSFYAFFLMIFRKIMDIHEFFL